MARPRKADTITPRTRNDLDMPALARAVRSARREFRHFREQRRYAVEAFAGPRWNDTRAGLAKPSNVLDLYVRSVLRSLVSNDPRVMFATFDRDAAASVAAMQDWANKTIPAIELGNSLSDCALDALFCMGIMKVALATPAESATHGWGVAAGQPYACPVDFDDFVADFRQTRLEMGAFIGHRYRAPIDAVKDSRLYSASRRKLEPDDDAPYDEFGTERVNRIGREYATDPDEYEPAVELWEIYLPRRRLVVTVAQQQLVGAASDIEPLRAVEWVGPDSGPYHLLGFGKVPGNPVPKAPVVDLLDMDEAVNAVARKTIRQIVRQKEVLIADQGSAEDAGRIRDARDGEIIRAQRPDAVKSMSYGGPSAANVTMWPFLRDQFSYLGGNLDSFAGLSPQSKTASQDKLLAASSAGTIADMQDRTVAFASRVVRALGWFWWHDPVSVRRAGYSPPGVPDIQAVRTVSPQNRQRLPWDQLDITVDPYSLQHQTPQQKAAMLDQIVTQVIVPALPILQQQGYNFDMGKYLEHRAAFSALPELMDIVSIQEPPGVGQTPDQGGQPGGLSKPASTTRNYVRESVSGGKPGEEGAQIADRMQALSAASGDGGVMNQS